MHKWFMVLLLVAAAQPAKADYDYTGLIQKVYSGTPYGGLVFIQVASAPWGVVACDNNGTFDFAFDASTTAGKITLSAILTAYAAKNTIRLTSTNQCTLYSGVPDLSTFTLE